MEIPVLENNYYDNISFAYPIAIHPLGKTNSERLLSIFIMV